MTDSAIEINEISRKFRLGDSRRPISAAARRWLRLGPPPDPAALQPGEFWALRNLSLNVKRGEAVALIGPNGAGKSTALKLLAGIMPPTAGAIRVSGRISALIEVGAGFHPDLTGRENIYLNASVLGMSRAETREKFDRIVEFAGIESFLDTPLKRYSSGMYARLGFSVAAHADPDILIVDEVLSVGDRVFRSRCMDRMREFLRRGVAILFVSHDLATVAAFCDRACVLRKGDTIYHGTAGDAVEHYHRACGESTHDSFDQTAQGAASSVLNINIRNVAGESCRSFGTGERIRIEIDASCPNPQGAGRCRVRVLRARDLALAGDASARLNAIPGAGDARAAIELSLNVPPGEYALRCAAGDSDRLTRNVAHAEARIIVRGKSDAGGLAELQPIFNINAG